MRMRLALVVLIALLFPLASAPAAAADKPIEVFTCFAASLGTGRAGVVEISINRWSTDEEREMLLTTLQEKGRDALLAALEKIRPPVGYMRTPNSLGYDLYYARNESQPDGSRRVTFATNRRVNFREASTSARSMDYQFTLVEIRIDKDGKGEGKMVPAAKIVWDAKAKKIEIENYSAQPVDLINVKAKTP